MKKCIYCDGEVKPMEEFFKQNGKEAYEEMKKEFKKVQGVEWKPSKKLNCIKCGQVYDEKFKPTNFKLGWLGKTPKYPTKIGTKSKKTWQICKKCSKRTRSLRYGKRGGFLCYTCWIKEHHPINCGRGPIVPLEEVLSRVYEVKGYINKTNGQISASIGFPSILIGHKIKIVLVDEI